jgi:hypothetical protein
MEDFVVLQGLDRVRKQKSSTQTVLLFLFWSISPGIRLKPHVFVVNREIIKVL